MKKYIKYIMIAALLIAAAVVYASGSHDERVYNSDYDRKYHECRNTGILSEGTIKQKFTASKDSINGLAMKTTLHGDVSEVMLEYEIIEDENEKSIVKGEIPAEKLENDKFYRERFAAVKLNKGESYTIILKEKNATADSGIGFYFTPAEKPEDIFCINENETAGTLVIRTIVKEFQMETFVVLLLFILYIVVFLKILYKLFK